MMVLIPNNSDNNNVVFYTFLFIILYYNILLTKNVRIVYTLVSVRFFVHDSYGDIITINVIAINYSVTAYNVLLLTFGKCILCLLYRARYHNEPVHFNVQNVYTIGV